MPTSKSDLASGGLDGDRLEVLGGGQQLGIEPAQLADRRLILPDGGALSGGEARHGVPSAAWFWNSARSSAWSWCTRMIRATVASSSRPGWARAGCSRPSCPTVTSIPSRMCWVNQPTCRWDTSSGHARHSPRRAQSPVRPLLTVTFRSPATSGRTAPPNPLPRRPDVRRGSLPGHYRESSSHRSFRLSRSRARLHVTRVRSR